MSVVSFEFIIPLLLAAAIFFHIRPLLARQVFLALANAAFLILSLNLVSSWIALAVFVLSGFFMARVLEKRPSAKLLAAYLILFVGAFLVLKKYVIIKPILPAAVWAFPIETLGMSYLLFRQIHVLVDVLQGQITGITIWGYLNYQLNLFGFESGPIQRYQEFDEHWKTLRPVLKDRHEVMRAFIRLFIGLLKIPASTYILQDYIQQRSWLANLDGTHASRAAVLIHFARVFYGYPIYLYFNFSGYCDVVIAGAAMVGIQMPDNFDRPYLSRNILDFWTRFHQTLGFWIRDYLFTPMYKAAASRWPEQSTSLVFPCYFTAFLLAGVWHGSTLNFVVFGFLHGVGASVTKGWELLIIRRVGRKGHKQYVASLRIRVLAILFATHFVAFTMLFFPTDMREMIRILREMMRAMI